MPPKHLTGGKCLGNKADGNGRNNAIFPDTMIGATLVRPDLREMSPSRGAPSLRGAVGGCPPVSPGGRRGVSPRLSGGPSGGVPPTVRTV